MTKNYGIDTGEYDDESYEAMKDLWEHEELDALIPDQDYVNHIVNTVKKTVKCEDALIRQILYAAVSKDISNPPKLGYTLPNK